MKTAEFKVTIDGVEKGYFVRKPGAKLLRKAEEHKAVVFKREAFKKDENGKSTAIFADEVYNLMREHGVWSKQDELDLERITKEIDSKISLLSKGKSKEVDSVEKLREIVINDIKALRTEQFKLLSKSSRYNEITVEAIANEAENDYITCFSTFEQDDPNSKEVTEDSKPAFASLEAYQEADEALREEAARQTAILMGTNDPDWALKLPENKILQDHKLLDDKGFYLLRGVRVNAAGKPVNEKGQLVNETGEAVDEYGNRIDENGKLLDFVPFD